MASTITKSKSISLCTWNSRGMSAAIPYVRELIENFDIIMLTEHWLHSNKLNKLNEISPKVNSWGRSSKSATADDYGCTRGQGGVAILWKKDIIGITPLNYIKHDRICGIRFENPNGAIFNIICAYLPAKGSDDDYDTIIDELSATLDNTEEGSINIIGGDLNADMGRSGGPRSPKVATKMGKKLLRFSNNFDLYALNLAESAQGALNTFIGPNGESCIDYIMVPSVLRESIVSCVTKCKVGLNTSDHNPVTCVIDFSKVLRMSSNISINKCLRWDKLSAHNLYIKYTSVVNRDLQSLYENFYNRQPTEKDLDVIFEEIVYILKKG